MTEITISDDLAERIKRRTQETEFGSVDEYTEFVLSEVLTRIEHEDRESSESTSSREEVKSRLESLGYLED